MYGRKVMARRLLSVGMAAVLVHGCLIPQDDPVLPPLPQKMNRSPEVRLDSATPASHGAVIKVDPTCIAAAGKDRPFGILVVDEDLDDRIQTRWFVDPDIKFTTVYVEGAALTGKTAERGISRPLDLFYGASSPLYQAGPHTVIVVVSDRDFIPGGIDLVLGEFENPDGGTIADVSRTARYTWEVTTDRSTCQ